MSIVHVVPLRDVVEHDVPGGLAGHGRDPGRWLTIEVDDTVADTGCVCGPAFEVVPRDDGPDGWLVTHHSLDGREQQEVARGQ